LVQKYAILVVKEYEQHYNQKSSGKYLHDGTEINDNDNNDMVMMIMKIGILENYRPRYKIYCCCSSTSRS
jgi:hypothetical protein